MAQQEIHTLIPASKALKILTFVTYHGLRHGSRGTDKLTRFPHGLYSQEECIALRDELIQQGVAQREKKQFDRRQVATELI